MHFISYFYKMLMVCLLVCLIFPYSNTKAEIIPLDLVIDAKETLFGIENFKPGDWAERTVKVTNRGREDFAYRAYSEMISGSDKLYNALETEIRNGNELLFKGRLANANLSSPRPLKSYEEEQLQIVVRFPAELGNEFQGLQTKVLISFTAEAALPGGGTNQNEIVNEGNENTLPSDVLPKTGEENPIVMILTGILLAVAGVLLYKKPAREQHFL
ncbi:LPXTG cell wall anchor domain-containing protein [Bacillus mangrovi]|uniref:LPXTG cell wall anchor domain-containing protein n=1 Tax=Metabacillus mangrovi TaxID=1491830 RepID=A0A7X2S761_9BACI|nr:LPXTG cell wall anchor domain-containing protein [Metabacillus mangrovi]MTH54533.1 LPXTG cell wall anchor domain-containing protein [Metabacillus mangrovi]